jgi:plasmid stabilization system protein ParE
LAHRVLYRRRAERDLERLARGATVEWFDELCDAVESLAEFPERCAYVAEPGLRLKGVRQLLYGKGHGVYRVLYRVKDEDVEILTILHARRKPISR